MYMMVLISYVAAAGSAGTSAISMLPIGVYASETACKDASVHYTTDYVDVFGGKLDPNVRFGKLCVSTTKTVLN